MDLMTLILQENVTVRLTISFHIIDMFNLLNTFFDQENTVYLDKLYFIYYMQTGLQWIFI